jgi:hypothetical protein
LTPVVSFLDQLLASDPREEPPMREHHSSSRSGARTRAFFPHFDSANDAATMPKDEGARRGGSGTAARRRQLPVGGASPSCRRRAPDTPNSGWACIDALMQFWPSAISVAGDHSPLISCREGHRWCRPDRDTGLASDRPASPGLPASQPATGAAVREA